MGQETSKARARRQREGYFERIFVGAGSDIGCGDDPVTADCVQWDRPQGDAQTLPGLDPALISKVEELLIGLKETERGRQILEGLKSTSRFDRLPAESQVALGQLEELMQLVAKE